MASFSNFTIIGKPHFKIKRLIWKDLIWFASAILLRNLTCMSILLNSLIVRKQNWLPYGCFLPIPICHVCKIIKKRWKKKNLDYDLPFWFWLFSLYFVHAGKSRPQLLFRCLWAELVHHWARLEGSVLQVWPSCRCEHCVWPAVKTLPGLCVCLLRKSRWCQRGEQKRMFIFYFF